MKETNGILDIFGKNVFTPQKMKERLDPEVFSEYEKTAAGGQLLSRELAYKIASVMKDWAIENGATHYTHWFQPLTNNTAEKHNAFLSVSKQNEPIIDFTGKNLVRDEVDASSFPSGGSRATFEARGYTVWDCTSPAFIKEGAGGSRIFCVPTAFCSFTGEVLDKKIPLLKSLEAVERESLRLLRLLGNNAKKVRVNLGAEQEYFLVDKSMYQKRKDLIFCGRTLFGAPAPKGQEKEDQYYATLRERVLAFMTELNGELWKTGIPAKIQHNETAPGQHELAPLFSAANIATDQNQLTMEIMRKVADRHGLSCILHEKPFEGVNGSGKHCNWSLSTDDGKNIFKLNPENITSEFLLFFVAVIAAVDEYQDLLRLSAANPGNDLRLGGNEAPPAIISVYTGSFLAGILEETEKAATAAGSKKERLKTGVSTMPSPFIDNNDRNRTSPFAFTGNKFEFRLPGASVSTSTPITILNAITAQKLSEIADVLESKPAENLEDEIRVLLSLLIKKHKRILFDGNNYSPEWKEEAKKRGLSDIDNCIDAMECYKADKAVKMLDKTGVLNAREVAVRYEINLDNYIKTANIDGLTMLSMADTEIIPAVLRYRRDMLGAIKSGQKAKIESPVEQAVIAEIDKYLEPLYRGVRVLEAALAEAKAMKGANGELRKKAVCYRDKVFPAMKEVRRYADTLEKITAKDYWPFPTYSDILFYE